MRSFYHFPLPPKSKTSPPTTTLGSSPAFSRTKDSIEVVVVLPWVLATAMPQRALHEPAQHLNWVITGIPFLFGKSSSQLSRGNGR